MKKSRQFIEWTTVWSDKRRKNSVRFIELKELGLLNQFFDKDEELKAAEESGLYDKDLVGASEIDKQKATTAPLDQLKAILADDDLRKKDKAYIEKLVADRSAALDAANAALKEAEEEKLTAAANNVVMQDNSTSVYGGGQSSSVRLVPISDSSVGWM